jgi:hypothetical protein
MGVSEKLGFLPEGGHKLLRRVPRKVLISASGFMLETSDWLRTGMNIYRAGDNDIGWPRKLSMFDFALRKLAYFVENSAEGDASCFAVVLDGYGNLPRTIRAMLNAVTPFPRTMTVLLHGEPGTGKSHFMSCISSSHRRLEEEWLKEGSAKKLAENIDSYGLLIDEVDELYARYPSEMHALLDDAHNGKFGNLFVVMTTNHFDKIKDTPLVRPGRVDRILEIGAPTERDLDKFFSLVPKPITRKEVEDRVSKPYTMAKLGQAVKDIFMEKLIAGEME